MAGVWQDVAVHIHIRRHAVKENLYRYSVVRSAWRVGGDNLSTAVVDGECEVPIGLPLRAAVVEVIDRVAQDVVDS